LPSPSHVLDKCGGPFPLLEPPKLLSSDFLRRLLIGERDEPVRPPERVAETVEEIKDTSVRLVGVTLDGDDADVEVPDLWTESSDEWAVSEDVVQVRSLCGSLY